MYELLRKGDRGIALVEKSVVALIVLVVLGTQIVDVALREAGRGGLEGAAELARWMVLALAFLGASLATAERRHITIDLLDRAITPRVKAVFNLVVQSVGVVVVLYLAWGAWELLLDKKVEQQLVTGLDVPEWVPRPFLEQDWVDIKRTGTGELPDSPKIPMWPFLAVAPISLLLISWRLFLLSLEDLRGLRSGRFDYLSPVKDEGRLY